MVFGDFLSIGLYRFLLCTKVQTEEIFSMCRSSSSPKTCGFVKAYSLLAASVSRIATTIKLILGTACFSEVIEVIVSTNKIFVINVTNWPESSLYQPSQSVPKVTPVINADHPVSINHPATSTGSRTPGIPFWSNVMSTLPVHLASFSIICENVADVISSEIRKHLHTPNLHLICR